MPTYETQRSILTHMRKTHNTSYLHNNNELYKVIVSDMSLQKSDYYTFLGMRMSLGISHNMKLQIIINRK